MGATGSIAPSGSASTFVTGSGASETSSIESRSSSNVAAGILATGPEPSCVDARGTRDDTWSVATAIGTWLSAACDEDVATFEARPAESDDDVTGVAGGVSARSGVLEPRATIAGAAAVVLADAGFGAIDALAAVLDFGDGDAARADALGGINADGNGAVVVAIGFDAAVLAAIAAADGNGVGDLTGTEPGNGSFVVTGVDFGNGAVAMIGTAFGTAAFGTAGFAAIDGNAAVDFVFACVGGAAAAAAAGFAVTTGVAAGGVARSVVITTGPFFAATGAIFAGIFAGTTNAPPIRGCDVRAACSSFGAGSVRAIAIVFGAAAFIGIAGNPISVCFAPGLPASGAVVAAFAASSFADVTGTDADAPVAADVAATGCAMPAARSSNVGARTSVPSSSFHSLVGIAAAASSETARAISICSNTRLLGFVTLRRPICMPGALKRLSRVVHVAITTPSPASAGSPLARSIENAVSSPSGRGDCVAMKIALSSQKRWNQATSCSIVTHFVRIRSPRV
jgi:hypothetical protein